MTGNYRTQGLIILISSDFIEVKLIWKLINIKNYLLKPNYGVFFKINHFGHLIPKPNHYIVLLRLFISIFDSKTIFCS